MTRKDYVLIAGALYQEWKDGVDGLSVAACRHVEQIAASLADALAQDNPRFDREHFLAVVRGERAIGSKPLRKKGA